MTLLSTAYRLISLDTEERSNGFDKLMNVENSANNPKTFAIVGEELSIE